MSMRKFTFFILCLFLGIGLVAAQTKTITGTVISNDDGEPVIGATIVVKGNATVGTITDYDGNFTLNVPDNAKTLVISYIGVFSSRLQPDQGLAGISPRPAAICSAGLQIER